MAKSPRKLLIGKSEETKKHGELGKPSWIAQDTWDGAELDTQKAIVTAILQGKEEEARAIVAELMDEEREEKAETPPETTTKTIAIAGPMGEWASAIAQDFADNEQLNTFMSNMVVYRRELDYGPLAMLPMLMRAFPDTIDGKPTNHGMWTWPFPGTTREIYGDDGETVIGYRDVYDKLKIENRWTNAYALLHDLTPVGRAIAQTREQIKCAKPGEHRPCEFDVVEHADGTITSYEMFSDMGMEDWLAAQNQWNTARNDSIRRLSLTAGVHLMRLRVLSSCGDKVSVRFAVAPILDKTGKRTGKMRHIRAQKSIILVSEQLDNKGASKPYGVRRFLLLKPEVAAQGEGTIGALDATLPKRKKPDAKDKPVAIEPPPMPLVEKWYAALNKGMDATGKGEWAMQLQGKLRGGVKNNQSLCHELWRHYMLLSDAMNWVVEPHATSPKTVMSVALRMDADLTATEIEEKAKKNAG